jgi:XTP/dITP diphosphohydrolase
VTDTKKLRLLFATTNPGKQREIRRLLAGLPLDLLFLDEFPGAPQVEETGMTFEDNAALKAAAYAPLVPDGCVAAEDSGLVVPALGGEPGVYSARYGGRPDDASRNNLLLERMLYVKGEDRAAHYEAVVVLRSPDGSERTFTGRVDGLIALEPHGEGGFGYDPVFFHPALGMTFGLAGDWEKDALSHRGEAVRKMRAYIEELRRGGG